MVSLNLRILANGNQFVDEQKQLINANVFIVSVPTPVDK